MRWRKDIRSLLGRSVGEVEGEVILQLRGEEAEVGTPFPLQCVLQPPDLVDLVEGGVVELVELLLPVVVLLLLLAQLQVLF
jgi:hypothetical protein